MEYPAIHSRTLREERIDYLSSAIQAHQQAMSLLTGDQHYLQDSIDLLEIEYKFLSTSHRWLFNFVSGGWNSVIAPTREQAIQIANETYNPGGGKEPLVPDANTFRVETSEDFNRLMSSFY